MLAPHYLTTKATISPLKNKVEATTKIHRLDKLNLTLPSERVAKKTAQQAAYLANLANEGKALQSTLAMVTDKHVVEIKKT